MLVYWLKPAKLFLVIPWPGRDDVELKETISDKNGYFKIPKYSNNSYDYYLTIYKKGYVCWSNKMVFPTNEERTGFTLKNGTVIQMERFKEEYNKLDHANFVQSISAFRKGPGIFDEAVKEEIQLLVERAQQRRKEWEEEGRRK